MKSNSANWFIQNKELVISVAVLAVVGVVAGIVNAKHQQTTPVNLQAAKYKQEKDEAALIKAALDVYYVNNGTYPVTLNELVEASNANPNQYGITNKSTNSISSSINALENIDYKLRGDGKAFTFSYISIEKNTESISGNYDNDFH